jgi:phosphate transport system permease protein
MTPLADIGARRRRTDRVARTVLVLATGLALVPLVLILFYLVKQGLGAWSLSFFTTDPSGRFLGDPGGIRSAILGTIEIVALASAIAVPAGLGVALYLVEYGRDGRFASAVRYFVDVMTGVPSIAFGLFIYITLVLATGFGGFAGWKGSLALALLMLPSVTRSAEVLLTLVPDSLREAALALGYPRWRASLAVVLRTATAGIVTGALVAVARIAGETAPLLFTAFGNQFWSLRLDQPIAALPLQIFTYAVSPYDEWHAQAWAGALVLIALVLVISVAARLAVRSRYAGGD